MEEKAVSEKKRTTIFIIIASIALLSVIFIIKDWNATSAQSSRYLKYAITCLCVFMAWTIVRCGLSSRDTLLIGIIFGGILIADFFLLILDPMDNNKFDDIYFLIGLWLFAIVQILHIIRYNSRPEEYDSPTGALLKRFWSLIKDLELKRDIVPMAIIFVLIYIPFLLLFIRVLSHPERISSLVRMTVLSMIVYFFIISLALYLAWRVSLKGFFKSPNTWMIAAGMTLFFCCDASLSTSIIIKQLWPENLSLLNVTSNLVWIFYSPAITLLSISGYEWKGIEGQLGVRVRGKG